MANQNHLKTKRKSFKKIKNLDDYHENDFDDKELKYKYFKIKLAQLSNEIEEKLFEKIFGYTLIKLAEKLINTTNKNENQIIVKNILKSKDAIDLILNFHENKCKNEYEDYENENEYEKENEDDDDDDDDDDKTINQNKIKN